MKKIVFALALSLLSLPVLVQAQALPGSATSTLSAVNISQGNKDAAAVGVKPGDAVRFSLTIESQTDDVSDYVAIVDVSALLDQAEIIDITKGKLEGSNIVFNAFSHKAPCKEPFSFFVRFKECKNGVSSLNVSGEGKTLSVPTSCGGAAPVAKVQPKQTVKLPTTGPSLWLFVGILGVLFMYGMARIGINPKD